MRHTGSAQTRSKTAPRCTLQLILMDRLCRDEFLSSVGLNCVTSTYTYIVLFIHFQYNKCFRVKTKWNKTKITGSSDCSFWHVFIEILKQIQTWMLWWFLGYFSINQQFFWCCISFNKPGLLLVKLLWFFQIKLFFFLSCSAEFRLLQFHVNYTFMKREQDRCRAAVTDDNGDVRLAPLEIKWMSCNGSFHHGHSNACFKVKWGWPVRKNGLLNNMDRRLVTPGLTNILKY